MEYTFPHNFIFLCPESNFLLFGFPLLPRSQFLSPDSRQFHFVRHLVMCFSSVFMDFLFPSTFVVV